MNALSPSAKNANQVSTTAFSTIDSQLSKKRCGRPPRKAEDEDRADGDHEGQEQLRQRDDEERDAQEHDVADRADDRREEQVQPRDAGLLQQVEHQLAGLVVERVEQARRAT